MLLRLGYLLQGVERVVRVIISAKTILFADNTNYKSDSDVIKADNNSNIV
ncbi:MAG: hypothetical protein OIF36_01930 [Alphaproteobacteria bacterium]|nr:hypothetical protein [Alphaproteobacteria bacterium]